jgi:hypothetical protein
MNHVLIRLVKRVLRQFSHELAAETASCGLSSKVGLIVSIFPKVCSILWAPWSMDFFHKWSSCWSLRVKIEDDPPWPLWCLGLTSEWCQDGYSSDFPLCEPKSRCKTFLSLSYRCHSIQGLKPDPFSYRWRFFSSPEIKRYSWVIRLIIQKGLAFSSEGETEKRTSLGKILWIYELPDLSFTSHRLKL